MKATLANIRKTLRGWMAWAGFGLTAVISVPFFVILLLLVILVWATSGRQKESHA